MMSSEISSKAGSIPFNRRKFIKGVAVLAGISVVPAALVACGDPTATTAPASGATAASATTAAVSTTAVAPTTAAPATAAPTTAAAPATAAATTAAAAGAAPAGFSAIGPAESFKADADPVAIMVNDKKGFVYNKGGQVVAFSNICTHKGCEVPYKADQNMFVCPCHGSQYDKTGEVVKGPAPARLPIFETKVVGSTLYGKAG